MSNNSNSEDIIVFSWHSSGVSAFQVHVIYKRNCQSLKMKQIMSLPLCFHLPTHVMRMSRLKVRLSARERKESASSGKLVNSLLWMMVLMTMGEREGASVFLLPVLVEPFDVYILAAYFVLSLLKLSNWQKKLKYIIPQNQCPPKLTKGNLWLFCGVILQIYNFII